MNIYLAARYQDKPLMRVWKKLLEEKQYKVISSWVDDPHDPNVPVSDFTDVELTGIALRNIDDLANADVVFNHSDPAHFRTGRGGRHVEFGIAVAKEIPIVLIGERENVFHWIPEIHLARNIQEAIHLLDLNLVY